MIPSPSIVDRRHAQSQKSSSSSRKLRKRRDSRWRERPRNSWRRPSRRNCRKIRRRRQVQRMQKTAQRPKISSRMMT